MSSLDHPPAILLASASPRRRELLDQIGVSYRVVAHGADERHLAGESPETYVRRMAHEKAISVAADDAAVLGADTVVVCDDRILGKPRDREHALHMLGLLSGREHHVCSAVTVCRGGDCRSALSTSRVRFRQIGEEEREAYWRSGEPEGKAGGYAIQGLAAVFVRRIEGNYSGIMGLPLFETAQLLAGFGIPAAMGCFPPESAGSGRNGS